MPNFRIPPPPTANNDQSIWAVWYMQVKDAINRIGESFSWTLLNFTGSNLTDIVTRNHNDLNNSQGGNATQQYHLTLAQHTDLTDAGDSTSHYHASDRDSANFTGTNWTDLTDGGETTLHKHFHTANATLDFPSIASNATAELTVTVTGATAGNSVSLGPPASIEAGLTWCGYVSAADTVSIRVHNITGGALDPASGTWHVCVEL